MLHGLLFLVCVNSQNVAKPEPIRDTVIMIHGAGGGGWEYDKWKPVFAKVGWKVIAKDLLPAKGGLEQTKFQDYLDQTKTWVPKSHRRLVIIGASMGGILTLKLTESLKPDGIILINSVPPAGISKRGAPAPYPPVVHWANGPIQDTRDSLPDGDEATIQWAHPKWRDESGTVLNQIRQGIPAKPPTIPSLVIIGGDDKDVKPEDSKSLAKWASAKTILFPKMSHIGPLMGLKAKTVAGFALKWCQALEHK